MRVVCARCISVRTQSCRDHLVSGSSNRRVDGLLNIRANLQDSRLIRPTGGRWRVRVRAEEEHVVTHRKLHASASRDHVGRVGSHRRIAFTIGVHSEEVARCAGALDGIFDGP